MSKDKAYCEEKELKGTPDEKLEYLLHAKRAIVAVEIMEFSKSIAHIAAGLVEPDESKRRSQ